MKEKGQALSKINKKIESISEMSLSDYLVHMKEKKIKKCEKKSDNKSINSESTLDELIEQKLRQFEIFIFCIILNINNIFYKLIMIIIYIFIKTSKY